MSINQINYSDPVLEKINELIKKIPGWALKCSERMQLNTNTVRAIKRGERGKLNGRRIELLEVLIELNTEQERKIKKLTA